MDWAQTQDANLVSIFTTSPQVLGPEITMLDAIPGGAGAVPAVNTAIFFPFLVYQPFLAQKILVLNGVTISGNVDVGIYDSGQHRLVSVGSTAQSGSTLIQTFDITDTTLLPGEYYMALAASSVSADFQAYQIGSVTARPFGVLTQASAFPLPNPATMVGSNTFNSVFVMAVLGRSLV